MWLELLLNALISGLSVVIGGYVVSKLIKRDAINELLDYIESQEGLEMLARLGASFAAGAMSQMKFGKGAKGVKIGPIRVPQQVVDMAVLKGLEMLGVTAQTQPQG